MMLGETILSGASNICSECGVTPKLEVLKTCAYYVGTHCNCGPYSRETDYFQTKEEAEAALAAIQATGAHSSVRR